MIAIWNIFTFFQFGVDKYLSKRKTRRIREWTLLQSAFMLGGVGSLFGMYVFRHKTRHKKFTTFLPISAILTVSISALLYYYVIYK